MGEDINMNFSYLFCNEIGFVSNLVILSVSHGKQVLNIASNWIIYFLFFESHYES